MQYFYFSERIPAEERRKRLHARIREAMRRETQRMGAVALAAAAAKVLIDTTLIYVF
ncbi:MAG: hypothetical protein ACOCVM_00195 [Desulfovibrionaceae bacterium]